MVVIILYSSSSAKMAALVELQKTPELGQLFLSFDTLKKALQDWSVRETFSFKVEKKDQSRGIYRCIVNNCPWRVRANRTTNEDVKITVLNSEHNCIAAQIVEKRTPASTQTWLQQILPDHLVITKDTRPREIVDCLRLRFGEEINYQVALRVKKGLLEDGLQEQREGFTKLPAYIENLRTTNPTAHIHLSIDPETRRFQRVFICPSESRESFRFCRHFIAVDGTFLKSRFRQTLLLAVTIDANGNNLLLAWAIVEAENESSWEYFYLNLQHSIPELTIEQTTLISDRDKGLINADRVLPPTVIRAFCCYHLKENFTTKFGRALEGLFWKVARARRVELFEAAMQELRNTKPSAEAYLRSIDPLLWTTAFFPRQRYGHDTSNIVESTNKTLKIDRELSMIQLLDTIWHKLMAERFSRLQLASKPDAGRFTKFCLKQLSLQRPWARTNRVQLSSTTTGRVTNGHDGQVYLVDLAHGTCSCMRYQENQIPCGHAIACILQVNRPLEEFLPNSLSIDTWRSTYTTNLQPVDITYLALAADILPPFTRIQRGRPRKARVRPGEARQRAQIEQHMGLLPEGPIWAHHCQTCGNTGHNTATCSTPHQ